MSLEILGILERYDGYGWNIVFCVGYVLLGRLMEISGFFRKILLWFFFSDE